MREIKFKGKSAESIEIPGVRLEPFEKSSVKSNMMFMIPIETFESLIATIEKQAETIERLTKENK